MKVEYRNRDAIFRAVLKAVEGCWRKILPERERYWYWCHANSEI